jgi:hypothetical protein
VTAEDFHGDGRDGEVAIVWTHGELGDRPLATLAEHVEQLDLEGGLPRQTFLSRHRGAAQLTVRGHPAATSGICSLSQAPTLRRAGAVHPGLLLLVTVPELEPGLSQDALDGAGRTAEPVADATHADPVLVQLDDLVSVEVRSFRGHVYNLQTETGWYAAGGILTHNCRSTTVPVLKSWKELGIPLKEARASTRASFSGQVPGKTTYGSWLKGQPVQVQDHVLGKGRAQLFRRGVVPMEKFIDRRYRPLSLRQLEDLESKLAGTAIKVPKPKAPRPAPRVRKPKPPPPAQNASGQEILERVRGDKRLGEIEVQRQRLRVQMQKAKQLPSGEERWGFEDRITNNIHRLDLEETRIIKSHIKVMDPVAYTLEEGYALGREGKAIMEAGEDAHKFVSSVTSRRTLAPDTKLRSKYHQRASGKSRAYQNGRDNQWMRKSDSASAYVHEIGHNVEIQSTSITKRAQEMLKARASKDPKGLRPVRPGSREKAWHDEFLEPYMGKHYPDGATELVSMGLEYLYREPMTLLRRDPDYFVWLLDTLRGVA